MLIQDRIDRSKMSGFQISVVAICLVINVIDGFDVLVMSFAASGVADEWALSESEVGLLLSSGLVGMALGSAFLAPLADRVGRRRLTLVCLALCTFGMVLSSLSTGPVDLGFSRLLTGLGIGGTVASLPVIITEFTPKRLRGTMIALYATGLPVGGILGGAAAQLLVSEYGWRAPFIVGGVLTFVLVVTVAVLMPESLDYLLHRRPKDSLAKVNRLLDRMHMARLTALPTPQSKEQRGTTRDILNRRMAIRSALLWIAYFIVMAGFYFAASWTPRLLEQSGFSAQQGMSGGVLLNLGGLVGTLLLGVLALKVAGRTLTALAFVGAGLSFLAMNLTLDSLTAALISAVAIGMFINASGAGLNSIAPGLYPAPVRATGVGWAMAFGRIGALTAPILAGVLLDSSWSPRSLFGLLVVPMIAAAIVVLVVTVPTQERTPVTEAAGVRSPAG
ncbi:MFS transporter [Rhodococcus sp. JS3073]|uniref:MFS transporter n=1 Tax=Rhodococcus sp. JS3073 TaxID=3002901 RepID=UPI0022866658|nr:MFS transporter [Rhodococcus sp. JS3073]WAM20082.1 MFS transporter [Rhodococcus sp. JS3073]